MVRAFVLAFVALAISLNANAQVFTAKGNVGDAGTSERVMQEMEIISTTFMEKLAEAQEKIDGILSCQNDRKFYNPNTGDCLNEEDPTVYAHAKSELPSCADGSFLTADGNRFSCEGNKRSDELTPAPPKAKVTMNGRRNFNVDYKTAVGWVLSSENATNGNGHYKRTGCAVPSRNVSQKSLIPWAQNKTRATNYDTATRDWRRCCKTEVWFDVEGPGGRASDHAWVQYSCE